MKRSKERPDPQRSLVGFQIGSVSYALPITNVREIINPIALTELPHAPASVVGVADHRGEVITVLDLRRQWGLAPTELTARSKWILVEAGELAIGLIVDQVTGVFGTGGQQLKPAPKVSGGERRGFLGVLTHEGRLTYVLDVTTFEVVAQASVSRTIPPPPGVEA